MSTVITITGRNATVRGRYIEHFRLDFDGVPYITGTRTRVLYWFAENTDLHPDHVVNLLDESLVSPVSTEA